MSLYAIGDLHLSLGVDKPMDIFRGWENYIEKLSQNWLAMIQPDDTVLIAGDVSWGMNLEEAREDFAFLHQLPGQKILLKGNHDYWFSTKKKVEDFFKINGFASLHILFNNSYLYEDYSLCGTRGWIREDGEPFNQKILSREAGRMKLSLDAAEKTPIVFMHYPPLYAGDSFEQMLSLLHSYHVQQVYYGHLHGKACKYATVGQIDGIEYHLISGDYLEFVPELVIP